MSTSAISSSLLSQILSSSSTANQFATDLNQVAQDLQGGNLSAAQQDFVTLSQDALDGATSSTATTSSSGITTSLLSNMASSSASESNFANELNQLGTDLTNGDLSSAQGDMLSLDSMALNSASQAGAGTSSTAAGTATATNQADAQDLIQAIVQGMGDGDNSLVSTAMSELASVSPSSQGATILQQMSSNYGSSSSSSPSSSSSVNQLLQSLNADSSGSSSSLLNALV